MELGLTYGNKRFRLKRELLMKEYKHGRTRTSKAGAACKAYRHPNEPGSIVIRVGTYYTVVAAIDAPDLLELPVAAPQQNAQGAV